jgi:hypothetical protein
MATTYIKIATVSVGVLGSASIELLSIPATYSDLVVKLSARSTGVGVGTVRMKLNTDTSANYNYLQIQGDGSGASTGAGIGATSASNEVALYDGSGSTLNTFSNTDLYFPNYTSSNSKTWSVDSVEEENNSTAYVRLTGGVWSGTAAISAITFTCSGGNFAQYSTATLYGIKKN